MQIAVIEYSRNVLGLTDANSSEFDEMTPHPVINLMESQKETKNKGGTMRLGEYDCQMKEGTYAHKAYGREMIRERHRHRYELNNEYRAPLEESGLVMAGTNPELDLVEIVEVVDHPWFVGVQFHPEFTSRPNRAQPLFRDFITAAVEHDELLKDTEVS